MKIPAHVMALTLLLMLPVSAFALGTETFGNAPAVKQPEWADGVIDVVNLKSRVYSKWVNGNESFYYQGNAEALSEALRAFAAVKDEVRQLILMPGAGKTHTFQSKPIEFHWQLHVPSGLYKARAATHRQHAVMTVYLSGVKPRPLDRKQVEPWLGDLDRDSFQVREKATEELQKLGNDAKPFLRAALKTDLVLEARRRIESLLERLRDLDVSDLEIPKGVAVVTVDGLLAVHLQGLNSANIYVGSMAMMDLSRLESFSDKIVPALTGMLAKDKNEYLRRIAAGCLGHIGMAAKSAVPMLKQGLDDPDDNVRAAFQAALEQLENAKADPGREERIRREHLIQKQINEVKNR